jgi:hypothetical protein
MDMTRIPGILYSSYKSQEGKYRGLDREEKELLVKKLEEGFGLTEEESYLLLDNVPINACLHHLKNNNHELTFEDGFLSSAWTGKEKKIEIVGWRCIANGEILPRIFDPIEYLYLYETYSDSFKNLRVPSKKELQFKDIQHLNLEEILPVVFAAEYQCSFSEALEIIENTPIDQSVNPVLIKLRFGRLQYTEGALYLMSKGTRFDEKDTVFNWLDSSFDPE